MCRFIAYRGFESPSLRQNTKPAQAGFFVWRREVSRLRGLRGGFEGKRLQAFPRPAERRRILPLAPSIYSWFLLCVHQEPPKLLMYRQNAKKINQLDGPLKNWAIFYGRSLINPAIIQMLEGVTRLYTHQYRLSTLSRSICNGASHTYEVTHPGKPAKVSTQGGAFSSSILFLSA